MNYCPQPLSLCPHTVILDEPSHRPVILEQSDRIPFIRQDSISPLRSVPEWQNMALRSVPEQQKTQCPRQTIPPSFFWRKNPPPFTQRRQKHPYCHCEWSGMQWSVMWQSHRNDCLVLYGITTVVSLLRNDIGSTTKKAGLRIQRNPAPVILCFYKPIIQQLKQCRLCKRLPSQERHNSILPLFQLHSTLPLCRWNPHLLNCYNQQTHDPQCSSRCREERFP